jgi:hypothetical protein
MIMMTKLWCGEVVSSDSNLTNGRAFALAWTSTRAQKRTTYIIQGTRMHARTLLRVF